MMEKNGEICKDGWVNITSRVSNIILQEIQY